MKTTSTIAPAVCLPPERNSLSTSVDELASFLRCHQAQLRDEWIRRIKGSRMLSGMSESDVADMAEWIYDGYVEALEYGGTDSLRSFLLCLPDLLKLRGVSSYETRSLIAQLRDVVAHSLFYQFRHL